MTTFGQIMAFVRMYFVFYLIKNVLFSALCVNLWRVYVKQISSYCCCCCCKFLINLCVALCSFYCVYFGPIITVCTCDSVCVCVDLCVSMLSTVSFSFFWTGASSMNFFAQYLNHFLYDFFVLVVALFFFLFCFRRRILCEFMPFFYDCFCFYFISWRFLFVVSSTARESFFWFSI